MLKSIPNAITLANAFGGCVALFSIFSGQIAWLPWILAGCLLADFADGLAARLLKASSNIGKELDSLADMVSFGVVPGAIFFYLINQSLSISVPILGEWSTMWGFAGFILSAFAALRLAKFNLDTRQTESFVGLNTPATTLFALGLLLIVENDLYGLRETLLQWPLLLGLVALLSYLLVAEIPIFSFKFKKLGWAGNEVRILFLLAALACLIFLKFGLALVLIIVMYVLSSLLLWAMGKTSLGN